GLSDIHQRILIVNVLAFREMGTEEMFFSVVGQSLSTRHLNKAMGIERVCHDCLVEMELDAYLSADLLHLFMHARSLLFRKSLYIGKIVVRMQSRLRFERRVELKTTPDYLHLVLVGKLGERHLELVFSDITERATYVRPDIDLHF